MRSFVGLCSYYRRFIDKFAQLAKPLTDLTRKGITFTWGAAQQESFELLKAAMTETLLLAFPDYSLPFEIHPDACGYGLGAVLLQKVGGVDRPLAYASRLMTTCEQNYSVTEQECLALVWAVVKFRTYVWGRPITIVTDHHALCWLLSKRNLAGRLARWSLVLQEYQITIVHKSGRLHSDADALSRYPVGKSEELDDDVPWIMTLRVNADNSELSLREEQRKEWPFETQKLDNGEEVRGFALSEELLYKEKRTEGGPRVRVCVPKAWRAELLRACHDDITAGHMGQTRTLFKLQQRYYWPCMKEDVNDYVRNCQSCQARKGTYRKPAGLLEVSQRAELPFERVGMDILGPFPQTKAGNKYIIVAIDYITKWAETASLKSGDAQSVAEFFVKMVVLRHGAPAHLTTDQGKCFLADLFQKIMASLETNHRTTTAYHPQSNGQVERINHTLADMLSMYVSSDHTNWDEILPYVTFAYNTSRQDTTGRTPFYLMHGREAVLPIDVAIGINPNLLNGDEDPYEDVQLKLTRARAELEDKLRIVQEQAKARFDSKRSEPKEFMPGQKVLVYKPTRVVGRAEKLLHRWHGPYEVLVQTTPVNYLVHLPGKKKPYTEIVHVERLKAFYEEEYAPDSEGEQNYPQDRPGRPEVVEPNNEGKSLEDDSGHQETPSDSTNRPNIANPSEAGVNYKFQDKTEKEPNPPESLLSPLQNPKEDNDTESPKESRRYPSRIRKQRFALSLPMLLGVLAILQLAQSKELLLSQGVIFKLEGEKTFSDSEWVIVTDINLVKTQNLMSNLADWLRLKAEVPRIRSKANGTRFHSILQDSVRSRARDYATRLEIVSEQYWELSESIGLITPRKKRGLLDGGGKMLNWLFGISTTEDLEKINKKLESMSTEVSTIVHSLSDHATLVNETAWEVRETSKTLLKLDEKYTQMEKDFNVLDWKLGNVVLETEKAWETYGKTDEAFRAIGNAIDWLEQFNNNLSIGLMAVAMERLPPSLFPPAKLKSVLDEIKKALPPGWSLTPAVQAGNLWRAYQNARVAAATVPTGLRIFIHIPVYEFPLTFSLYRVISLPKASRNGTWALKYEPLPDLLAISSDRQSFIELSNEEARPCLSPGGTICPISRAIIRKRSKKACAVAVFLEDNNRIQRECSSVASPWKGPESIYLGRRRWGFSAAVPQQVVITCPNPSTAPTGQTLDLPPVGIFEVPMACTAQSENWMFQASFKKDLNQKEKRLIPPSLRQLDGPSEQWVTALPPPVNTRPKLATTIHEILLHNTHLRPGLKTLEQETIDISKLEENRQGKESPVIRYPFELIALLCVSLAAMGATFGGLQHREIRKRRELACRVRTVEERLMSHELDVGGDEVSR